jgi:uncharacterized damage-inducible protein DinB
VAPQTEGLVDGGSSIMDETAFRENLVELLKGGHAHVGIAHALEGLSAEHRHIRPATGIHTIWEELEHIRLAQEDILRYTLDSSWESPRFPDGYWPEDQAPTDEIWKKSVDGLLGDLNEFIDLALNKSIDLTARIPHGEGRTYLRQILLTADHNAYHLGQIVQTRKLLSDWKS